MSQDGRCRVIVVAPVYDDAAAAARFLEQLQQAFAGSAVELSVLLVDDGSPIRLTRELPAPAGQPVEVLRLKRNVGHQRAIAIGIAFVHEHRPCDVMLVMDADGEDRPEDAVRLVAACRERGGERIVFADRTRRIDTFAFQALYRGYQLLHWILTGIRVRVGNFSAVPSNHLGALVTLPALWNHYAAAIFHARLPRESVPTIRGPRYCGVSKMNLVSLVVHGLQAISVFIDIVAVRLLLFFCLLACLCVVLLAGALAAPVSWPVTYAFAAVFFMVISLGFGCFSLSLGLLAQRNRLDFIPSRDYHLFVEGIQAVARAHA